jgi:hypothetical protein
MAERGESFPWEKSETRARTWSDRVRVSQLAVRPAPTPRPYAARRVISGSAMPTQRMSSGISACCQCLINAAVTGQVALNMPAPASAFLLRPRTARFLLPCRWFPNAGLHQPSQPEALWKVITLDCGCSWTLGHSRRGFPEARSRQISLRAQGTGAHLRSPHNPRR